MGKPKWMKADDKFRVMERGRAVPDQQYDDWVRFVHQVYPSLKLPWWLKPTGGRP